jgi:hypothetical protein
VDRDEDENDEPQGCLHCKILGVVEEHFGERPKGEVVLAALCTVVGDIISSASDERDRQLYTRTFSQHLREHVKERAAQILADAEADARNATHH